MINFIKREIVLIVASILAIISSFISTPKLEYIDFKVLILLFNLMIIIAAFKEIKVLDFIATSILKKCTSYKKLCLTLVLTTFFASMIVTNDVALLTFVPLTLIITRKSNISSLKIIIFQTIAANLGSTLTPMGNPQNLYIYSHFNISTFEFFRTTLPLVLVSFVFLLLIINKEKDINLKFNMEEVKVGNIKNIIFYLILLIIVLLSVFRLVDYKIIFIIISISVLLVNKKLFLKVDYSLLLTFIAFFIFIGNISNLEPIVKFMSKALSTKNSTLISSILCSQIISNVPATMLLASFTKYYNSLLMGVNIGGLGTLIASLASIISYKLYIKENSKDSGKYIKIFTIYNILGLIILFILAIILNIII